MSPKLKTLGIAVCVLATTCLVEAQSPRLSMSFVPPATLWLSWPSNFTTATWQLASTTNPASSPWQPLPLTPFPSSNTLVVFLPTSDLSRYFRLQQIGAGGCVFRATPSVINSGGSSTLMWCPVAGYTYRISPGPGIVTGGSLVVSPAVTTVYSLTASNAVGVLTNFATVIDNPCGWLQLSNLVAEVTFDYILAPSTPDYNFKISHGASVTFHLQLLSATATDAYYIGFTTADPIFGVALDSAGIRDREDDKTGPQVFTTTEVGGSGPTRHDISYLSLHVTCSTYDFSYNVFVDTTETSAFGTFTSPDGVGAGEIVTRALPALTNSISDYAAVLAQYPPNSGDYFIPSSDLGEAMFDTGVVTAPNAGEAFVTWSFYPTP
jgi:hypothetical protein